MNCLEPNALLERKEKRIAATQGIKDYYQIWKNLRKEYGDNSELEAFIIGYMIGNNITLKEKFIKIKNWEDFENKKIDFERSRKW